MVDTYAAVSFAVAMEENLREIQHRVKLMEIAVRVIQAILERDADDIRPSEESARSLQKKPKRSSMPRGAQLCHAKVRPRIRRVRPALRSRVRGPGEPPARPSAGGKR